MKRRKPTKSAEQLIDRWISGPLAAGIEQEEREYVLCIAEALRPQILRQGERAVIAALELEDLILANVIARRADIATLKDPSKEKLEMANKASDRRRKSNAALAGTAAALSPMPVMGIGSRMRPLIKKAEGAFEAAIAETERRRRAREEPEEQA